MLIKIYNLSARVLGEGIVLDSYKVFNERKNKEVDRTYYRVMLTTGKIIFCFKEKEEFVRSHFFEGLINSRKLGIKREYGLSLLYLHSSKCL